MTSFLVLCGFVVACAVAAAMGALFPAGPLYAALRKPAWQPPAWLFAPVWTLLYLMMAIAGWLVAQHGNGTDITLPLAAFAVQLILNAAWTPLFFGARRFDLALVDIVVLWLAIAITIALFAGVNPLAAWLMVPYLAWVTFATALNASILRLNGPRPMQAGA